MINQKCEQGACQLTIIMKVIMERVFPLLQHSKVVVNPIQFNSIQFLFKVNTFGHVIHNISFKQLVHYTQAYIICTPFLPNNISFISGTTCHAT